MDKQYNSTFSAGNHYLHTEQWLDKHSSGLLLIDGQWVKANNEKYYEVINPYTEEVIGKISDAGLDDMEKSIQAARFAFEHASWADISPQQRCNFLLEIASLIERDAEELALIETLNTGMPIGLSRMWASSAIELFRYYAGWPTKMYGKTNPGVSSVMSFTLREPLGVCALIVPWNAPFGVAVQKIAPALACGNTVIIKPSPLTPYSIIKLGELMLEAGLPSGVFNILTSNAGSEVGSGLASHPKIDLLSFTGSTAVGKEILAQSKHNLKKTILELGGKSPNILFADADLEKAIPIAVNAFCCNSGQVCIAGSRLFVQEEIYDKVVDKICSLVSQIRLGSPLDEQTQMGPLISYEHLNQVSSYVDIGVAEGATLKVGGYQEKRKGFFFKPAIFTDVLPNMRIAQEENFWAGTLYYAF